MITKINRFTDAKSAKELICAIVDRKLVSVTKGGKRLGIKIAFKGLEGARVAYDNRQALENIGLKLDFSGRYKDECVVELWGVRAYIPVQVYIPVQQPPVA